MRGKKQHADDPKKQNKTRSKAGYWYNLKVFIPR